MNKKKLRKRQQVITNARAEASVIVLREVLATLPPEIAVRVKARALLEAASIGIPEIIEETDWASDPA